MHAKVPENDVRFTRYAQLLLDLDWSMHTGGLLAIASIVKAENLDEDFFSGPSPLHNLVRTFRTFLLFQE